MSTKRTQKAWSTATSFFIISWSILRIGSTAFIWISPLYGYFYNIFLDAVDGDLVEYLGVSREWYQQWDKWLDWFFFLILFIYTITALERDWIWWCLISGFGLRSIGTLLFGLTRREWILVMFPNFFSDLFWVNLAFPYLFRTSVPYGAYLSLLALIILCLIKEWWIHLAKIDISDHLFGKKKMIRLHK